MKDKSGLESEAISVQLTTDLIALESVAKGGTVECVVLNACETEEIGQGLQKAGVPHVVYWRGEVEDQAALDFAAKFYKALLAYTLAPHAGAATPTWDAGVYAKAFEQGRMAVQHWEESSAKQHSARAKTGVEMRETAVRRNDVKLLSAHATTAVAQPVVLRPSQPPASRERDPDGERARERESEQESARPSGEGGLQKESVDDAESEEVTRSLTNRKGWHEALAMEVSDESKVDAVPLR